MSEATLVLSDVVNDGEQLLVNPFEDVSGDVSYSELLESLWSVGRSLMDLNGLDDWALAYSSCAVDDLGYADVIRKVIVLSAPMMVQLPGFERRETVLHEIAHALCAPGEQHGPVWRATAQRLGATGLTRSLQKIDEAHFAPVVATCRLGHRTGYRRMPAHTYIDRMFCAHDDGHEPWDDEHPEDRALSWSRQPNAIPADMTTAIRNHPIPKSVARFEEGDIVRVRELGSSVDHMVAVIVKVGRSNFELAIPLVDEDENTIAVMSSPFEGVEEVAAEDCEDVARFLGPFVEALTDDAELEEPVAA